MPRPLRTSTRRVPLRTALGVGALAVAALAGSVLPASSAQARPAPGHATGWWSSGVAIASCGNGVLFTVPLSGARAHRISQPTAQNQFGYSEAWRTGRATPRLGLAPNGCGPESLVRFDRAGHGIRVHVTSPTGQAGTPRVIGHHGDAVTMVWNASRGCTSGATTLFSYDAHRGRSTAQLGTTVNGGTVTGAVPFPTDQ